MCVVIVLGVIYFYALFSRPNVVTQCDCGFSGKVLDPQFAKLVFWETFSFLGVLKGSKMVCGEVLSKNALQDVWSLEFPSGTNPWIFSNVASDSTMRPIQAVVPDLSSFYFFIFLP